MFKRMQIEDWFDKYQFEFDYDIGESGVKFFKVEDLGIDLSKIGLRYIHHRGMPELRELIASQIPGIKPYQIAITTGASEAIFAVIASLIDVNDHLIVEVPTFPSLYEVPSSLNMNYSLCFLEYEESFKLNLEKIASFLTPHTKLICVSHPNNPTGSVLTTNELEELIRFAEKRDLFLLVDETYRDLSFSPPPPLAASLSSRAISICSMSKAFGIPGIRIGWVVGDKETIESVCAVREQVTICNSILSETVAFSVLQNRNDILQRVKKKVFSNFSIMNKWINSRDDLEWIEPCGGVVGFPRLVADEPSFELCLSLIKDHKTFVIPGEYFKMPQHFRLGFGGNSFEIEEGLKRLGLALDKRKGNKLEP